MSFYRIGTSRMNATCPISSKLILELPHDSYYQWQVDHNDFAPKEKFYSHKSKTLSRLAKRAGQVSHIKLDVHTEHVA